MESEQAKWMNAECINISDPEDKRKYRITTDPLQSMNCSDTILVIDFRYRAHTYMMHPESKALSPDGAPCNGETRGLLQQAHVVVDKVHRISKECDCRWENGEDADALEFEPPNYDADPFIARTGYMVARERLIRKIMKIGIRKLVDYGCSRKILQKICRREVLEASILNEHEQMISLYPEQRSLIEVATHAALEASVIPGVNNPLQGSRT